MAGVFIAVALPPAAVSEDVRGVDDGCQLLRNVRRRAHHVHPPGPIRAYDAPTTRPEAVS